METVTEFVSCVPCVFGFCDECTGGACNCPHREDDGSTP
jgi:hypothetical protein